MIKAVVFDVDDTLYDQKAPFTAALAPLLKLPEAADLSLAFQTYRQQSAAAYEQVAAGIWSHEEMAVKRLNAALRSQNIPSVTTEIALAFQKAYCAGLQKIKLFPGLANALDQLKEHYKLGIITNGKTQHQLAKVMQLEMHRWVDRDAIMTSEETGLAKPDPQIFTLMNRRLNLRASEVVYIGDCYSMDVRAAKKAGWQAFWFNHRNQEMPDGDWIPDQTVGDPFELQDLLLALTAIAKV
ncbi:HAD superfamily hydrolase [Levilactobacillus koreensis JCM 16448]|uniref:HAD family hydrolase n=1 Tax=Levilactobacillus koreensis TaxID=637971 RepID=A0AAC8UXB8_9LACO|nr:HAD family hydrolase [Levilactobacillus koreensis]AKP65627.1 HAD family hydrolase [Levilactobacillus koreensis]KRK85720.1 HAD superfamily hydrolase [Levilactobacillus koreensis JCM 16448]